MFQIFPSVLALTQNNYTVTLHHQMNCSFFIRCGTTLIVTQLSMSRHYWASGSGCSAGVSECACRRGIKGHMVRLDLTFALSSSSGQTRRSSALHWLTGSTINRKFSCKCHLIFSLIKTFVVSF